MILITGSVALAFLIVRDVITQLFAQSVPRGMFYTLILGHHLPPILVSNSALTASTPTLRMNARNELIIARRATIIILVISAILAPTGLRIPNFAI
jgi:hypothetical protein